MAVVLTCLIVIFKLFIYLVMALIMLLLFGLCFALFSALKYDIKGQFPSLDNGTYSEMNFKWLLGTLRLKIVYVDEFTYDFRFMGAPVRRMKKLKSRTKNMSKPLLEKQLQRKKYDNSKVEPIKKDDRKFKGLNSFRLKLKKLSLLISKIKWHFKNICDIIKRLYNAREKFEKIFEKWIHKQTLENIKVELIYLLDKTKPKFFKLHANFGFEDPSHTGKILAIAGWIVPFMGEYDFVVIPEFEKTVCVIEMQAKGEVRLINVLVSLVRLIKDKGNRYTFRVLRRVKW